MQGDLSPVHANEVQDYLRSLPLPWPGPVERPNRLEFAFGSGSHDADENGIAWLTDDEQSRMLEKLRPAPPELSALLSVATKMLDLQQEITRWSNAGLRATGLRIETANYAEIMRSLLSQPREWQRLAPSILEGDAIHALVTAANEPLGAFYGPRLEASVPRLANAGIVAFDLRLDADRGIVATPHYREPEPVTLAQLLKLAVGLKRKTVTNRPAKNRPKAIKPGVGQKAAIFDYGEYRAWIIAEFPAQEVNLPADYLLAMEKLQGVQSGITAD